MDFQPIHSAVNTRCIRDNHTRLCSLIATEKRNGGTLRMGRGVLSTRGAMAVNRESGCLRRQKITEVYSKDQDVPPSLQKMVNDVANSRSIRLQGTNDRRQNATAKTDYQEHFEAKEMFARDLDATVFNWTSMASFKGCAEEFQPKNAGPTVSVTSAYEAFRIYWDNDILQHIVQETNQYAVKLSSTSEKFARDWVDTNVDEILILFAFWMMNGVIKMPSIKSCFSTNPLLKTGIFRSLLTEARYWNLNRALHFGKNKTRTLHSSKFLPLGPLVEHLNSKFKQAYNLHQNIFINEPLNLWKGKLYLKQKPVRFGIKSFDLCESNTGYLWSFLIYSAKDNNSEGKPHSLEITDLVVRLMKPLLNKGHTLFLNRWFSSPLLARYLKTNKTDCVGILKKTQKHVPPLIKLATLLEGTCIARHSGDVAVMAYRDKKTVYTISTCHGTEAVQLPSKSGRPSQYKPAVIADYNCSMGAVDQKDKMLEPYLLETKRNRKWNKKIFRRLLNASISNSRIIVDQSSAGGVKQVAYRLDLVNTIIERHLPYVPKPRRHVTQSAPILPLRFSGNQHFIVRSEVNGARTVGSSRSSTGRVSCLWCHLNKKKTKKTVYKCKTCDVPLCLEGCFESFHTP